MTSVADIFTPTVCFVLAGLFALPGTYFRIKYIINRCRRRGADERENPQKRENLCSLLCSCAKISCCRPDRRSTRNFMKLTDMAGNLVELVLILTRPLFGSLTFPLLLIGGMQLNYVKTRNYLVLAFAILTAVGLSGLVLQLTMAKWKLLYDDKLGGARAARESVTENEEEDWIEQDFLSPRWLADRHYNGFRFDVTSVYQDFGKTLKELFIYFLPQMLVMWFYLSTLWPKIEINNKQVDYMVAAILFVPLFFAKGVKDYDGKPPEGFKDQFYWPAVFYSRLNINHTINAPGGLYTYQDGNLFRICDPGKIQKKCSIRFYFFNEVTLRWFMDWLVNDVCVLVLGLSLPLFLAHTTSSKMDFILNAVAMLFVIELDDVDGLQLGNGKDLEDFLEVNPKVRNRFRRPENGPETTSGPGEPKTGADV